MTTVTGSRIIAWFSCGAASAVAAKVAIEKYGDRVEVVYCDTLAAESSDNPRFMAEVEKWLGRKITVIKSDRYATVEEVWAKRRYMSGPDGAPCTVELKKIPRFNFQTADDTHVFGLTADEAKRIKDFERNNPDIRLALVLRDAFITKDECYRRLEQAGIQLPILYRQGYQHNNCIGCVKATSPKYWAMVRRDYPEVFKRRAEQSREIGCRLARLPNEARIFLDELPDDDYSQLELENISCGPECAAPAPASESGN